MAGEREIKNEKIWATTPLLKRSVGWILVARKRSFVMEVHCVQTAWNIRKTRWKRRLGARERKGVLRLIISVLCAEICWWKWSKQMMTIVKSNVLSWRIIVLTLSNWCHLQRLLLRTFPALKIEWIRQSLNCSCNCAQAQLGFVEHQDEVISGIFETSQFFYNRCVFQ